MHASLKRIQPDDNTASSKFGRYSRLETISHDRLQYQINGITRKGSGDVREPRVYACIPGARVCVQRRTTCVCGLRRLTIRDAGIYGRGVHADCRNGASDATDKMISLFPLFFFLSAARTVKYRLCAVVGTENTLGGFGGGMPGSAAMISIARVGRRGSLAEGSL